MANQIQNWIHSGRYPNTELVGPVPCFFSRLNGYYRWQILLKGPTPEQVLVGKDLSDCRVSVNPPSLL
jgi:primosomal protein N' (replication factor Y)